jgi:periplasmic protein TonB
MKKLCALLMMAFALAACSDQAERPRKQQIVKLQLPDTPPPPPPPPKQEEKQPPKPEDKPQPQEAPKPVEAPQPQALKSDEAAGDGPGNGLTAGSVAQDYTDQKIGQGNTIGSAAPDNTANKFAVNAFANATTRALNEFLVRDKDVKRLDYRVRVEVWLTPAGTLQRAELVGSTGDEQTDQALRLALARFPGVSNPVPAAMPQPMRVLVSNRLMG